MVKDWPTLGNLKNVIEFLALPGPLNPMYARQIIENPNGAPLIEENIFFFGSFSKVAKYMDTYLSDF